MYEVIKNHYNIEQKCSCDSKESLLNTIGFKNFLDKENFIWERYYKIRGLFCSKCNNVIEIKYKRLLNETVFYNEIKDKFSIQNLNERLIYLLNKFKVQKSIKYETFITSLKSEFKNNLEDLWNNGIIKVHRRKINPKLTTPIEVGNLIPTSIFNQFSRSGVEITKISLTDKGFKFLEQNLKWDIKSQITTLQNKIQNIISEKLKHIRINNLLNSRDLRVKRIIEILQSSNLIDDRKIQLGSKKFDLITKYDELVIFIELLTQILLNIGNKKLTSLKEFSSQKLKLPKNSRMILKKILGSNLILFNIFSEPLRNETNSDVIFNELQNFVINVFEPEFKQFIIIQLKNHVNIEKIWSERIPTNIQNSIKTIIIRNLKKHFSKSKEEAQIEFKLLINNHKISTLIENSYFSAIPGVICNSSNWNQIFKKFFPFFKNSGEFVENFKDLSLIRNKLAHKPKINDYIN